MVHILSVGIEILSSVIFVLPSVFVLQYLVFRRQSFSRAAAVAVFMFYLMGVFAVVGIPTVHSWHFHPEFNWIPIIDIVNSPPDYIRNTVLNMILFMPLGFLVPMLWKEYRSLRVAVWLGLLLSLFIEILQMFTFRLTDVDDLITNTAGCVLGFYAGRLFSFRLPFGPIQKDPGSIGKQEPLIIMAAAFLIGFCLKPVVSDAVWDQVLSSPLWESIK